MKKAIILGVSKSNERSVYEFKKEQKAIDPILEIMTKLKKSAGKIFLPKFFPPKIPIVRRFFFRQTFFAEFFSAEIFGEYTFFFL